MATVHRVLSDDRALKLNPETTKGTTTEPPCRFIAREGARVPTVQEAWRYPQPTCNNGRQQNILILSVIDPLFLNYPSRSLVPSSLIRRAAIYIVLLHM
jgi:hypothetical protein